MTSRPIAVFLLLGAPAVALGQPSGGGRPPLLWVWVLAAAVLLVALAWLLFDHPRMGARRAVAQRRSPVRP